MTRISPPGAINDGGYVLLRGLVVMFIVLICFASLLAGMAVFSHRSAVILRTVQDEVRYRNTEIQKLVK
ncbi:hypothetical protein [Breznakiella homolactica]|uniref:Uncharacterized protein n=1 Tax=Breznakiella homolactica TaxID=2798577 RepID=A0A7T8BAJ2_9SPIR|nr:hypothetical protein [Breznakiella homolactica]QQO10744.1 hypothetical protein JFL75_07465 [Breznakiella homolactica]